jgi:hypothetical protein
MAMARRRFVTATGAFVGLAVTVATLAASSRLEYLTFRDPVALPGVTLRAATYSFEVMDYRTSSNVVSVRDRGTRQAIFLGITRRVDRPVGVKKGASVVFDESPRGMPRPINAWYPAGDSMGHQFIYGGR